MNGPNLGFLGQRQPEVYGTEGMDALPALVKPVAEHVLEAGGKRLRPMLTILFARGLSFRGDNLHTLASSLEFLHSATLMHDDILDNADLRRGRRSTWNRIRNSYIEPTLTNVVCGDIAMALPERILTNLVDGLERLNLVLPGVANDETLLYAPEIKFFATQVTTDCHLETSIRGLFVAGDAGLVSDLREVRKHAGLMVPSPVQAAMVALLDDDQHVLEQRDRYRRRRALLRPALAGVGTFGCLFVLVPVSNSALPCLAAAST